MIDKRYHQDSTTLNRYTFYLNRMEQLKVSTVENVTLSRRGYCISGTLILSPYHLVFSFIPSTSGDASNPKEIWFCYPIIDKISKARGSSWIDSINNNNNSPFGSNHESSPKPPLYLDENFDHYSASHIRIQCKDFTYYSFDFVNDSTCAEVFLKLSHLITTPKTKNDIRAFYAFDYKPNTLEQNLETRGWDIYDPIAEYKRQGLVSENETYWRISRINDDYRYSLSYPNILVVPSTISDNVLKHAGKFRSKLRIPSIVYRHRASINGNVIARCSQPLVGLNLQNRSIQDEKLIGEIFKCQERERFDCLSTEDVLQSQPQRNLIVDLRPITNAMAQHALGAGTENIDNYRASKSKKSSKDKERASQDDESTLRQVDKIFCNIDNIHVMRDSLNKLTFILNELDKYPVTSNTDGRSTFPLLQQSLTKTQWLHRLSIILQSVDRITKSIHLNNTNVVIHCSDGWDRTSQVSALLQLCLDPYYRTMKGFMVLIEKEWVSFGFKFFTRADHGGCIGATVQKQQQQELYQNASLSLPSLESSETNDNSVIGISNTGKTVTSFFQRAASHIKNTASAASSQSNLDTDTVENGKSVSSTFPYSGSNEKSPIFHQFLDCVYQLYRQNPSLFEFNSRFLKRLFYHYYSCQYGSFLCDSERESEINKVNKSTVSVWDYFNSRPAEFINKLYSPDSDSLQDDGVLFFNFTDIKWWYELYGRSDEEMNGLSNSLDRKFAQMNLSNTKKATTGDK